MKLPITAVALLVLATLSALAADISGKWTGQLQTPNGDFAIEFTFKQDGSTLTGTVQGPNGDPLPILDGKVEGDKLSFTVKVNDGEMTIHHTGAVSGDTIKLSSKTDSGEFPGGEMTLTRAK